MRILPSWIREFVDVKADDRELAEAITMAGVAVESVGQQDGETFYEMDVTTNRVDAMNHYGIARELSAIFDADLKPLEAKLHTSGSDSFPIVIEDAEGCARYTARIVRGVRIGASPEKLRKRFALIEQGLVNSAADATNYNLWEMGHPTHAFDLDKLQGRIVVRRARAGEKLVTLDGNERTLFPEDLVIADDSGAIAFAGLMGGESTKVTASTRNILIEAAWFDPLTVRRMARRHGMHTDASHRFERGADWNATRYAADRVAQLIIHSSGGTAEGELIDVLARRIERPTLQLRRSEVNRILGRSSNGHEIPDETITRILDRLGFKRSTAAMKASSAAHATATLGGARAAVVEEPAFWSVELPTWRLDIEREIDLIEEVARVYGYNNFPNTLPAFTGAVIELPHARQEARLRDSLLALGYDEALSSTFVSKEEAAQFSALPTLDLENPLSAEAEIMRSSLVPGMLAMVAYNLNRDAKNIRLFEFGKVFATAGDGAAERLGLSFGVTGNAIPRDVLRPELRGAISFFDVKGDVEDLLSAFEGQASYDTSAPGYYHPGRSARALLNGRPVGVFGQIHLAVAESHKIRQPVFVAEFDLEALFSFELRSPKYEKISRFPAVDRDFSFIFPDEVTFDRLRNAVSVLNIAEMRSFEPVEIFRGGTIPQGHYSLLLRASFQSEERTLRDGEVTAWSQQIISALNAVGGRLRS